MRRSRLFAVAAAVTLLSAVSAATPAAPASPHWRIADLGTLGGGFSEALASNDRGQVVGWSKPRHASLPHAFLWQNGRMTDLGTLGGDASAAVAVNDSGRIVGWSETRDTSLGANIVHAFLWEHGRMIDLGTLGNGRDVRALALNSRGQVVGSSYVQGADGLLHMHAFRWEGGRMRDLRASPPLHESEAVAINDRGEVVGKRSLVPGRWRAFLWKDGKVTDLGGLAAFDSDPGIDESGRVTLDAGGRAAVWESGTSLLPGRAAIVRGLNDRGQVIGSYVPARAPGESPYRHACLWQNGRLIDLTPRGHHSGTVAINDRRQVVGWTRADTKQSTRPGAFVWQVGRAVPLGTLGRPGIVVTALDTRGRIVGSATTRTNQTHAVLWAPTP